MQTKNALQDSKVNVKLKLAMIWTSFMFLYIYVDYFHLYMTGMLDDLLNGKVFVFDISQGFLATALVTTSIPALMIFLSVALPAKANRCTNGIIALLYIPYTLFNLTGEVWVHMVIAAVIEVVLLLLVIRFVWKWPRVE